MVGFKSFVDKTVVDLESGMTAVVGPNGCGKTNICDAIRWVLGEENVRLLRGTRAEDVIFAGTDLRKPVNFAEVSLTVSDVQDTLAVEYTEVTIRRRAFRSGDSEFFINNVPVRLKDIVDLFLGTGLGRRAYSVMERDMIDWILDDTAGQRRKIIEEAAGISKYKARRRETESKLELTQHDLERVQDLISEVERRVRQLARQAAKARRYERLTGRIREVETYASVKEHDEMKARRGELEKNLREVDDRVVAKAGQVALLEAEIEKSRLAAVEVDRDLSGRGAGIAEMTQAAQKIESEKGVLGERARSVGEKIEETEGEKQGVLATLAGKRGQLEAKSAEAEAAKARLASLASACDDLEREYRRLDSELRARREESVATARRRLEDVKRTIDVTSLVTEARARKKHLGEAMEKATSKRQWMAARMGELGGEIERAQEELAGLRAALAGEGTRLGELRQVETQTAETVEAIRAELQKLAEESARESSRHDVFRELVERYEGYEAGVRALVQSESARPGVYGVVGDIVRCTEPRFEAALAAALSTSLQYVVIENRDRAIDSVRMLKEGKKGPATLLLMDSIPEGRGETGAGGEAGGTGGQIASGDGVIGRILNYVDCEPRYRGVVNYLLKDVLIVEDLEKAFAISGQAANGFHDFVTLEGDAVLGGSVVRAGQNGATGDALIGRRQRLAELGDRVKALNDLSVEQERAFEELRRSLEELRRERDARQRKFDEASKPIADVERVLDGKRLERSSLESAVRELDGEIEEMQRGLAGVEEDLARLARDHGALPMGQGDLFNEKLETHDELQREVETLARRLEETNAEMLKLDAATGFLDQTAARIKSEAEELERDLAGLDARAADLAAKRSEIGDAERALVDQVGKVLEALAGLERERDRVMETKRGLDAAIEEARGKIRTLAGEKEQELASKQALLAEVNLLQVKSEAVRRRMVEEFEIDVDSVDFASLAPVENCDEELRQLRAHLRDLGPVNLVALDEFDTEKQRFDFLRTQRDDLTKARQSLDEAIVQINKRARTEFAETFEKVKRDFRKNFQTLFQGGDADLRLADENDPLESPVEILAQPTGKKLDHISLLSGGERALTALAFLFAVYYTKPSPFCLLDEVDAPLDDANVGRFVNLLKDFSSRTQFLMVTHNKSTMASASCLYGVTMQEPGVSRIVSVKLDRAMEAAGERPTN